MIEDQAFGAVVIFKTANQKPMFLLIKQAGNYWSFPKGHKESNETPLETAKRELLEETGITRVEWQEQTTFATEYNFEQNGEKYHKTNTYFLAFAPETFHASPEKGFAHEVLDSAWLSYDQAKEIMNFQPFIKVLDEVNKYLSKCR